MTTISRALTTVWQPHPLISAGREIRPYLWTSGLTVRDVLIVQGIDPHQEIVVLLNDRLLTVEEWDSTSPMPGDILIAQATAAGGGGGGSNPLKIVAMIAVSYFTAGLGGAMLGIEGAAAVGGIGVTIANGLVTYAATSLVNAIFPASTPKVSDPVTGRAQQESPTYSLSGGSNRARPYEPLPVVLGRHRVFPDYAAKFYTENVGDDQYLYQIFHFGIGNDLAIDDITIGETAIDTYQGVTITRADEYGLPGFWGDVDTTVGATLTRPGGVATPVIRTTPDDTVRIAIDLEAVLYYATDGGGLANRDVSLTVEYREIDPVTHDPVGAGTWLPFIPDASSVPSYWGKVYTTTATAPGYYDGAGVWHPPVVSDLVIQRGYDNNLSPSAHIDGASAGSYTDPEGRTHALVWRWRSAGTDPHPRLRYAYTNSTATLTINGASNQPKRVTITREVESAQYEVRLTRTTADSTSSRESRSLTWSAMRSYQDTTVSYADQTVLGVRIKASGQLNGAVQRLSGTVTATTEVWESGAWVSKGTLNPAWWYLHFARGYRNDVGRLLYGCGLSDSQIDIEAIKAWAAFCDTEGLTFSAVLDRQQTAADVLQMIARCGFASSSWASGKLGVVWDARNQSPVAAFGMGNIIRGSFEVSYLTDNLADEIIVSYIDPQDGWQQKEYRVTVPGTVGTPQRPQRIDYPGCISNAHAAKFANANAAQQVYRRRTISWDTDFEGFVCQRGDVVLLSHDLTQWAVSGRILAVDGVTVTLDRAVPRNGEAEYLMVRHPDGTMTSCTVVAATGESDTLTLTAPLALQEDYLPLDHLWFFSPLATTGKLVKITSVQPLSETRLKVIATDEDPAYYAAWDGVWTPPAWAAVATASLPVITGMAVSETWMRAAGGFYAQLAVSLTTTGAYADARAALYLDGTLLEERTMVGPQANFLVPAAGNVELRLAPRDHFGRPGTPAVFTHTVSELQPPEPVAAVTLGLLAYASNQMTVLVSWSSEGLRTSLPIAGYELRSADTGWGTAGYQHRVSTTQVTVPNLPANADTTWYIRPFDEAGVYAETSCTIAFLQNIAPAAVTNITATPSGSKLNLDWKNAVSLGETMYEVRLEDANWGAIDANRVYYGPDSQCLASVTVLGDHTFYIRALDKFRHYSPTASITYTYAVTVPATLTCTFATTANATLTLKWNSVSTSFGVRDYELSDGADTWVISATEKTVYANWTGSRTYAVRTRDVHGNYSATKTLDVLFTLPATPPVPVWTQMSVAANGSVTAKVDWADAAKGSLPVAGYEIRNADSGWGTAGQVYRGPASVATLAGVSNDVTTTWYLRAFDTAGNYCDLARTITYNGKAPPAAVTGFSYSFEGALLRLSWDTHPEIDVTGYEVRTASSGWGGAGQVYRGPLTTVTLVPPMAGATYYIAAKDAYGAPAGNFSTPVSLAVAYPSPSAPASITHAFNASAGTVLIDWADATPTLGLKHYLVEWSGGSAKATVANCTLPVSWVGDRAFTVKTVDYYGQVSPAIALTVTVARPGAVPAPTQVVMATASGKPTVKLDWAESAAGSLPVAGYEIRSADSGWGTAGALYKALASQAAFANVSTTASTIWYMRAYDTKGNYSATTTVTHDVTLPGAVSSLSATRVRASLVAVASGYTRPADFSHFEFRLGKVVAGATNGDDANGGVIMPGDLFNDPDAFSFVSLSDTATLSLGQFATPLISAAGITYYIGCRMVDTSGNWGNPAYTSITLTTLT